MPNYYISPSVVVVPHEGIFYAYNWDTTNYIEFDDDNHPFLQLLQNGDKELHDDVLSQDEIDFLLENRAIYISKNDRFKKIEELRTTQYGEILSLTLLPAEQSCNFDCVYCYEDHSLKSRMSDEYKDVILLFIQKQVLEKGIKHVSISYFGGEPLLNKPFIYTFQEELLQLSKKHNFMTSASMTTNGYLLDFDSARKLDDLNVKSYQITLDGLEEDHDKLRPLMNGKPTYQKIVKNLTDIANSDIENTVDIRVNFNKNSASLEKQQQIAQTYTKTFNNKNFRIRVRPIGDYASLNNRSCMESVLETNATENPNEKQFAYEDMFQEKGMALADYHMFSCIGSLSCYAGKDNAYVFSPDYSVKKCTVALDDPNNNIGFLNSDGVIEFNKNSKQWSEEHLNTLKKEECGECFLFNNCQGSSCQLANLKEGKALCPPTKQLQSKWSLRIVKKLL